MRIQRNCWSLDLGEWSVSDSPECVTICPPENDAALQISSSRKSAGAVTEADLQQMAEHTAQREGVSIERVHCGEFTGLAIEFALDEHHWRRWWVSAGSDLLFITYNTAPERRAVHRERVDRILASLKSEDVASARIKDA
jgi:hypothetical protein